MAKEPYRLVLLRHGESTWNDENKFTGWYDCPLSKKGETEAIGAGKLLKEHGIEFDVAYTSYLQRAIKTLWHSLEQTGKMYIPIHNAWQLNERHYGALQGLDKQQTVTKFGKDQVTIWRRSYDIPPPPCDENSPMLPKNDPRYKLVPETHSIKTESLKTTLDRVLPYWHSDISQSIKEGKKVIVAAHGNSLRALVKYLDNISDSDITNLNIPTGVPLLYELDENLRPIPQKDAIAPLSVRHACLILFKPFTHTNGVLVALGSLHRQPGGHQGQDHGSGKPDQVNCPFPPICMHHAPSHKESVYIGYGAIITLDT
ncbi:2,3-diphosphoglycerate-dependent phosphoglycerate mutase [archaeon]|nr:MAG: 2,3-diphosphoglycerate-dependent phosphoglycerate mutase [archaeon]